MTFIENGGPACWNQRTKPACSTNSPNVVSRRCAKSSCRYGTKGVQLDVGYKVDLLVERQVVVELKTVDKLEPVHEAQLLSYLRLSGCRVGLLINFNVRVLKDGIKRMVHHLEEQ